MRVPRILRSGLVRPSLLLTTAFLCVPGVSRAQNAEAGASFPPAAPEARPVAAPTTGQAPASPAPASPAPASPAAKEAPPASPGAEPAAVAARPVAPSTAPVARAEEGLETVSTREVLVPGGAPHSPATLHNAWADPRNVRLSSGATGGVGLLHVAGADLGPTGLLRFGLMGEYFTHSNFPVRDAKNTRTAGTFSLSYVPLDFLQVFVGYTAATNDNSRSSPNLIQALGDLTFGARATRQWLPGLWAGVDLRAMTFSGVGDSSVDQTALGFAPRLVGTYDLRTLDARLPLRAHVNLGLLLDGSKDLVGDSRLNASEEYALGINRYHRLAFAVGVEAPLPVVTPFLEYSVAYPLGVDGQLVAPDGQTLSAGKAAPKVLGLGAKVTALQDLTLTAAVELGLSRDVGLGVAATPPFNLFVGASYAVDVLGRSTATKVVEKVRERKVEAPDAKLAQVAGTVVDAATRKPLSGVLVAVAGSGLPPVATDTAGGRFLTYELPGGTVKLAVTKEGYRAVERELVLKPGEKAVVELALEAEAKPARLAVSVTSRKKPVAATVVLTGPKTEQLSVAESATGPSALELPAGRYSVVVTAPGHLAQLRDVQAADGAQLPLAFDLEPEPKKKLVTVGENKLELEQQVHFDEGKAVILPDSYPLLAQVVDALVRAGVKRVRVEGHTDNQGDKAVNLQLSKDRAQAMATWLSKAGIDASRLEVEGHGDSRPVAPNLTPRGRELNRRVDLVILER